MQEELKNKLSQFIADYYFKFDDNRIEFYPDELRCNYFIYIVDDLFAAPNPNELFSEGSLQINDNLTVTTTNIEYVRHYKSTILFDSWNDFIDYMKENCDWTEMFYMNWDSYKI